MPNTDGAAGRAQREPPAGRGDCRRVFGIVMARSRGTSKKQPGEKCLLRVTLISPSGAARASSEGEIVRQTRREQPHTIWRSHTPLTASCPYNSRTRKPSWETVLTPAQAL